MSNNKSPGIDYIPIQLYSKGGQISNKHTTQFNQRDIDRKESTYRLENKHHSPNTQNKGNKLQCHNYRGISLIRTGYKILPIVINSRFKKYTDHINGEYQAGFKSGKPTIDEIFSQKFAETSLGIQYRNTSDIHSLSECLR
jgi:hypothetical protein